jgi:hypothetical protein
MRLIETDHTKISDPLQIPGYMDFSAASRTEFNDIGRLPEIKTIDYSEYKFSDDSVYAAIPFYTVQKDYIGFIHAETVLPDKTSVSEIDITVVSNS